MDSPFWGQLSFVIITVRALDNKILLWLAYHCFESVKMRQFATLEVSSNLSVEGKDTTRLGQKGQE